jgi:hypothetical protein
MALFLEYMVLENLISGGLQYNVPTLTTVEVKIILVIVLVL